MVIGVLAIGPNPLVFQFFSKLTSIFIIILGLELSSSSNGDGSVPYNRLSRTPSNFRSIIKDPRLWKTLQWYRFPTMLFTAISKGNRRNNLIHRSH